MYVLVRNDLPGAQPAVQAGHALAEFLLKHRIDPGEWRNGTLVYLAVPNEFTLQMWQEILESKKIRHSYFEEPDIGGQMTAVCVLDYPDQSLKALFSPLKLL
jgi:hypothetical protein